MNIGPGEIAIFVIILLLLFGATRLPLLARSVGQSVKELKKGMREAAEDDDLPATSNNRASIREVDQDALPANTVDPAAARPKSRTRNTH